MKKRMKQMGALLLTLAMMLSLSVSAFASPAAHELGGAGVNDATNAVETEGPLPSDVTDVVLPTSSDSQFKMIFDSHRLLKETEALRFDGMNDGGDVTDVDESRFFFQVNTNTIIDAKDRTTPTTPVPYALKTATTVTPVIPKDTVVVRFVKGTSTKIYAQNTGTKTFKWMKINSGAVADVVPDTDFGGSGAYKNIAALKNLDPTTGYGLDAIAKINKEHPNYYLRKTGEAFEDAAAVGTATGLTDATEQTKLVDAIEYEFVTLANGNGTNELIYVYFDDNGSASRYFTDLGPSAAPTELASTSTTALTDFADGAGTTVSKAVLKVTASNIDTYYYRDREVKALLSLKATSAPVTVINKTNADIAVEMSAELTGIKGGDGTKSGEGAAAVQTYVYAKDYDAASGKFYDNVATATTRNVIQGGNDGVPVFYFALTNSDGDTEVMTYDSETGKASVSLGAMVPGKPTFFEKGYDKVNRKYFYTLANPATREADFSSMTLNFVGAIDEDDDKWDELSGNPNISVTWKIKSIADLAAPTVTKPTTVSTKSATAFQITNTDDKLVLVGIKQGDTEIAEDKLTITTADDTGTTAVTVAKGIVTGTEDLVFTFQHPTETYRTKEITVSFS